jgi:hypothetical protein
MADRSMVARGVLTKVLKRYLDEGGVSDVSRADAYLDEALDALEFEEPSLVHWLETNKDLELLMFANTSAIYWTIHDQFMRGRPLEAIMPKIDRLIGRVVYAAVWRAIMRERERLGASKFNPGSEGL